MGMLFVLAYPQFSQKHLRYIEAYRLRHEPERAVLVRPHITLVFGVSGVESQKFLAFTKEVVDEWPAFSVTFHGCKVVKDNLDGTYKVFLQLSEGSNVITALHRALYDGAHRDQFRAEILFEPHMTVATSNSRKQAERAVADLSDFGLPVEAGVSAIAVERWHEGVLINLSTFSLCR